MSCVARRKLNFTQLDASTSSDQGLRDTTRRELAERSCDKVLMWTSGSYDYDDVVRALVRLDRPEMRPGYSGQSGKTVPTCFSDPEADAWTPAPGSEAWTQPSIDRPHWNEVLEALQEDVVFCEDGETTIARDGAIAISGVFLQHRRWSGDDRGRKRSATDIIAGTTSLPTPWVPGRPKGSQCFAEVQRFLRPQTRCKWQRSGTAHDAFEHSTAEIAHEV